MNTCVCCGVEIPEGRQVCPNCNNIRNCYTCIHKDNSFYGCSKADVCFNGKSAYMGIKRECED